MLKCLTVKEVIEKLQKFDPDLPVGVYSKISEDMDVTHEVELESKELNNFSSCKGDHVLSKYMAGDQENFKNGLVVIK